MPEPSESGESPQLPPGPEPTSGRSAGSPRTVVTLSKIVVAVLIGALGFAIVVQVRDDGSDDYSSLRGEDLVELLKSLDTANERLGTQIDDLTATRNDLLSRTRRTDAAKKQAKLRADQLAILAGTKGASGPGVEVTINDPEEQIDAAALLDAIEELRDAGAEVIELNGVARVVAQTYFLDDDNQIRVGGREIKRPYVITAIGSPSTLAEAVRFRGGLIAGVENRGGTASVVKRDKVTITALADVKTPEYAQPTS